MKTIWVIVQTEVINVRHNGALVPHNCEPRVSFGGSTEREAIQRRIELLDRNPRTDCVVKELSLDGYGHFRASGGYRDDDVLVSKMPESKFR